MINTQNRKFKKLLSNPKAFLRDSKLIKDTAIKKLLPSNVLTSAATVGKKTAQSENFKNKKIDIYINKINSGADLVSRHLQECVKNEPDISLHIGSYRLKSNEILFYKDDNVLIVNMTINIVNNIIDKGSLLIDISNNEIPSVFNKVVHKINVSHMKSIGDYNSLYFYYKDRPECTDISKAKYALNAGIYTDDIINLALRVVYDNYLTLHQNELNLFFRKLYRVLGTDQRLEQLANKLAQSIRKQVYPVSFIMLLAAFFTEAGEYDKAIEMAKKAKSKDKNAWVNNRYLGLSNLLFSMRETNELWAEADSTLFKELRSNEWIFELYAKEHIICSVGNSPNEIGKKQGHLIDENQKVARFNGAITEYPFVMDYGQKTNILVMNPRYYETQRNGKLNLDFIIISDGNLYSSKNLSLKLHDLGQYCNHICLIPRSIDIGLTKEIGSSPSSGLKFLTWLYKSTGQLPKEKIYGFSMIDQKQGMATSYCKGIRVGLNTIHNWEQEKRYLESMLK